jgi:hypothetical protein
MIAEQGHSNPREMLNGKSIRCFVRPLALIALVLIATTIGSAWHHHQNTNSEDSCQICHLSHQPIERPLAAQRSQNLIPIGVRQEPLDYQFVPSSTDRRVPARAPPSA